MTEHLDRNEVIKRIKAALKRKTGKTWSVTGGRGTGWGWITVQAPKSRRISVRDNPAYVDPWETPGELRYFEYTRENGDNHYTSRAACAELALAFGLSKPVHYQGLSISPEKWEHYLELAEARSE